MADQRSFRVGETVHVVQCPNERERLTDQGIVGAVGEIVEGPDRYGRWSVRLEGHGSRAKPYKYLHPMHLCPGRR